VGQSKQELKQLKHMARQCPGADGRTMMEDSRFRDRIAQLEIELLALEFTVLRLLSDDKARLDPGPVSSVLKIRGAEIQQSLAELQMQALGPGALPWIPEALEAGWEGEPDGAHWWAPFTGRYFNQRKTTIYGGSNEIQRNIIAQRILGF
jgi:alkylation response protein AidB-like acyl-CoA dehydrogenase